MACRDCRFSIAYFFGESAAPPTPAKSSVERYSGITAVFPTGLFGDVLQLPNREEN